jgi:hypothetical protein
LPGRDLYRLPAVAEIDYPGTPGAALTVPVDLARVLLIRSRLDDSGRTILDAGLDLAVQEVIEYQPDDGDSFDGKLNLLGAFCFVEPDSARYVFVWQLRDEILRDYRIFFHLYEDGPDGPWANYDFIPPTPVSRWGEWDLIFTERTVPLDHAGRLFHVGLFDRDRRLGTGYWSVEEAAE